MKTLLTREKIKWGLVALLSLSLLFAGYFLFKRPLQLDSDVRKTLDSLEQVITLKNDTLTISQNKVAEYGLKIASIDTQIASNGQKIIYVKKYYNEKVNSIDSFSNDSIYWFFTNRYAR